MKTAIIALTLTTFLCGQAHPQDNADSLKHAIQKFFFDLPTDGSLGSLEFLLKQNKNFKRRLGKTYDPKTTIEGQVLQDKNLNPNADHNQLLVSVWGDQHLTNDTLVFGWYIFYEHSKLELATKNRDDFKALFLPLFSDMEEDTKQRYHGEIDEHVFFRTANKRLEICLTKYERSGRHRVSIIYTEIRE